VGHWWIWKRKDRSERTELLFMMWAHGYNNALTNFVYLVPLCMILGSTCWQLLVFVDCRLVVLWVRLMVAMGWGWGWSSLDLVWSFMANWSTLGSWPIMGSLLVLYPKDIELRIT
jgi:hypothetical protein